MIILRGLGASLLVTRGLGQYQVIPWSGHLAMTDRAVGGLFLAVDKSYMVVPSASQLFEAILSINQYEKLELAIELLEHTIIIEPEEDIVSLSDVLIGDVQMDLDVLGSVILTTARLDMVAMTSDQSANVSSEYNARAKVITTDSVE